MWSVYLLFSTCLMWLVWANSKEAIKTVSRFSRGTIRRRALGSLENEVKIPARTLGDCLASCTLQTKKGCNLYLVEDGVCRHGFMPKLEIKLSRVETGSSAVNVMVKSQATRQINPNKSLGKLLLATGRVNSKEINVLDLNNVIATCESHFRFPGNIMDAVGGYISGFGPVICGGGRNNDGQAVNDCYSIGIKSISKFTQLALPRRYPNAVKWDQATLWITGGFDPAKSNFRLNTTDLITANGQRVGPTLPIPVSQHCITKMNATTMLLTGGTSNTINGLSVFLMDTWYFDLPSQEWSVGPKLLRKRLQHACGTIKDTDNGHPITVVAGGKPSSTNHRHKSTEFLIRKNVPRLDLDHWQGGPDLPIEMSEPTGIVTADGQSLIALGGKTAGNVYVAFAFQLSCFSQTCQWQTLKFLQDIRRFSHVAILVPDSYAECN